jgi:hypothetical protein
MLRAFVARFLVAVACLTALAGCGEGDSESTGTLTMVKPLVPRLLTNGLYVVPVQASYLPDNGVPQPGFPINIDVEVRTPDGDLLREIHRSFDTDSNGFIPPYGLEIEQGALDQIVKVTASNGGLSDWDYVTVPALAPLTSTPAAVTFPGTAAAGSFTTVSLSGGVGPYSAAVDAAHSADLEAVVTGNNLIITKRTASDATGPVKLATVTVSGANSAFAPLNIGVSYQ